MLINICYWYKRWQENISVDGIIFLAICSLECELPVSFLFRFKGLYFPQINMILNVGTLIDIWIYYIWVGDALRFIVQMVVGTGGQSSAVGFG